MCMVYFPSTSKFYYSKHISNQIHIPTYKNLYYLYVFNASSFLHKFMLQITWIAYAARCSQKHEKRRLTTILNTCVLSLI